MKRLFYLSGTMFFLALTLLIGFHLGVRSAEADFDPSLPGEIKGAFAGSRALVVFDASGLAYNVRENWVHSPGLDLPVAPDQVKFIAGNILVSLSDEVWSGGEGWTLEGTFPGGTAVESTTWGQLKTRFPGGEAEREK